MLLDFKLHALCKCNFNDQCNCSFWWFITTIPRWPVDVIIYHVPGCLANIWPLLVPSIWFRFKYVHWDLCRGSTTPDDLQHSNIRNTVQFSIIYCLFQTYGYRNSFFINLSSTGTGIVLVWSQPMRGDATLLSLIAWAHTHNDFSTTPACDMA